jgi:hypothetical protein
VWGQILENFGSYLSRLNKGLLQIELEMMELIEASTIEDWRNDPFLVV